MFAEIALAPAFGHAAVAGKKFGLDVVAVIAFAPVGGDEFEFFRAVLLRGAVSVAPGTDQAAGGDIDLHGQGSLLFSMG